MFGISLDGPQLVLILEYCAGGNFVTDTIPNNRSMSNNSLYCLGSLDKLLYSSGQTLSDERKLELIRGIARGVLHLHKHNIVHRDLAARNILLTSGGEPKISVRFLFLCVSLLFD
jgi:serine/threonine protein kinase